ncbi:hypothetical protein C0585_00420 [Candidatus Woesearchaeota archaeon]|nr:MAG: hypothetical protein C0585_00420 [Candidatus Woesearchaeota archaeon]
MIQRKLISFGKNSYVVSLPKNWITRNGLAKGDEINIDETFDMLVLSTKNDLSLEESKIKKITPNNNPKCIVRKIINAYINNYHIIEIRGDNLISDFDNVRNCVQDLLALEIMELGPKKILIKDFLNTSDISLDNILKRIDMIIRAMFDETKEAIEDGLEVSLDSRDKDINRMFYVANKLINKVLEKPKLAKDLKIPIKDIIFKWRILVSFEIIGDQLKRLIRLFKELENPTVKKNIIKVFLSIHEEYNKVVKSLYKLDKDLASEIIDNKKDVLEACDGLLNLLLKDCNNPLHVVNISFIVEKLKRLENNICNISKAIIAID